jgi:hypothetical protein
MFQLDNAFLEEVGLGSMPEDQKDAFKAHIQEELETRVGAKMSEGLSEQQISEFEKIIDGDEQTIRTTLAEAGDYRNDQIYKLLIDKAGFQDGSKEIENEYASVKWLTKNRPDYQQIVAAVASDLKKEISSSKDAILGNL